MEIQSTLYKCTADELADLFKELFDSCKFLTFQDICNELTKLGHVNSLGRPFTPGSVSTALIKMYPEYRQREFVTKVFTNTKVVNPAEVPDANFINLEQPTPEYPTDETISITNLIVEHDLKRNYPAPMREACLWTHSLGRETSEKAFQYWSAQEGVVRENIPPEISAALKVHKNVASFKIGNARFYRYKPGSIYTRGQWVRLGNGTKFLVDQVVEEAGSWKYTGSMYNSHNEVILIDLSISEADLVKS